MGASALWICHSVANLSRCTSLLVWNPISLSCGCSPKLLSSERANDLMLLCGFRLKIDRPVSWKRGVKGSSGHSLQIPKISVYGVINHDMALSQWAFEHFRWRMFVSQVSLGVCFVLMFGNAMLLTSFYASSLVCICVSQPTSAHHRKSAVNAQGVTALVAHCLSLLLFVCLTGNSGDEGEVCRALPDQIAVLGKAQRRQWRKLGQTASSFFFFVLTGIFGTAFAGTVGAWWFLQEHAELLEPDVTCALFPNVQITARIADAVVA